MLDELDKDHSVDEEHDVIWEMNQSQKSKTNSGITFLDSWGLRGNVLVLSLTSSLTGFFTGTYMFFLPLLMFLLGATIVEIGLLIMVRTLSWNLSKILSGILSDRIGRKHLIVIGTFLAGFAQFFYGYFLPDSPISFIWYFLFIPVSLENIALGMYAPPRDALIAESTPTEKRGTSYGSFYFIAGISLALGPIFGGLFLASYSSLRPLMFLTSFVYFLASLVRYAFLEESKELQKRLNKKQKEKDKTFLSEMREIFTQKSLIVLIIAITLIEIGVLLTDALNAIFANEIIGLSEVELGEIFTIAGLFGPFSFLLSGKVADKIGRKKILCVACSLIFAFPLLFVASKTFYEVLFCFTLYVCGYYLLRPSYYALIADLTFPERRATVIGLSDGIAGYTSVPAPFIGAWCWENIDSRSPYILESLVAVLALIFTLLFVKEK